MGGGERAKGEGREEKKKEVQQGEIILEKKNEKNRATFKIFTFKKKWCSCDALIHRMAQRMGPNLNLAAQSQM